MANYLDGTMNALITNRRPLVAVIDDDFMARQGTANLLRSMEVDVVMFGSAQEFIDSGQATEVSCLISDLQMPGLNGLELQERLVAEGQNMPVIIVTGFPSQHQRRTALDLGAVGFLSKPFRDECLMKCLDKALSKSRI
jgi:FixJ family two-component response regulator